MSKLSSTGKLLREKFAYKGRKSHIQGQCHTYFFIFSAVVSHLRTFSSPSATLCSTSESRGTLRISGVEYSLNES